VADGSEGRTAQGGDHRRGIRNAYSFNWDGAGNLFTVSNGPDAHAPEEMDYIVPPRPGEAATASWIPYQFGDAPADKKWYRAHAARAVRGDVRSAGIESRAGGIDVREADQHVQRP
jgi:hypothetical protein